MTGYLDRRHKWEPPEVRGAAVVHRCRACGMTVTYERLVPDYFVEQVIARAAQASLFRRLLG